MKKNENKLKVLYIIDRLGSGGKERRLVQLIRGLENREISSKVIVLTGTIHYKEIFDLKTDVMILDRKIRKDPLIYFKLYKICRDWKPDIIHAWGSMPAVYAGPVARLTGTKLINASIANAPGKLERKLGVRAFFTFPLSDIIQANSYAGIKAYGVPEKKASVVHNGFDFGRLSDLEDRESIRNKHNITTEYAVGMVSVFREHKDYRSFILAGKKIIEIREDTTFICVGDGPELERMKKLAGGSKRIIFTGKIDDIESVVNIFDIGILLTDLEKHGEGISNSIMEYMALEKPVIATDGGGTPELVIDGKTGFLIPDKSPRILTEKIERLLEDREMRARMGKAGKERIKKEFTLDKMVEEHISLYRKLLG